MQTSEDISTVQLDILTSLSRFERTLDLPQTEIEGFVNGERGIHNNQRIIVRVVNATSRNILSSGLIYRTLNIEEDQEILEAITVQIKDLRSLLGIDNDIDLLQPEGDYPVSHLRTNLQIASLFLQGLEEQINQRVTPTAIPDSIGAIGQQHPPCGGKTRSEDHHSDDVLENLVDDDPEYFTRDDDDDVVQNLVDEAPDLFTRDDDDVIQNILDEDPDLFTRDDVEVIQNILDEDPDLFTRDDDDVIQNILDEDPDLFTRDEVDVIQNILDEDPDLFTRDDDDVIQNILDEDPDLFR